ncbi:alkaline phosphatase family protein [Arthrobacter sp. NPDC056493]|uniref:alkaline phosphatase family protein n=1 Tax=Arthrobacter sp. NPDC056493 TaxID=3345839 RepID=UPI00366E9E54
MDTYVRARTGGTTLRTLVPRVALTLFVAAASGLAGCQAAPSIPGAQQSGLSPSATVEPPRPSTVPSSTPSTPGTPQDSAAAPGTGSHGHPSSTKPQHVFVINLENKDYDAVWGPGSEAPYLSGTLRGQGLLLTQYYGTAHHSAPDYIAQISGQASNPANRDDCPTYEPLKLEGTADPGQILGSGCVYPASVPTLPGQLQAAGKTWKGYMEDMGKPCRHPALGEEDRDQKAKDGDQYATRHNPFVYFQSITSSPDCAARVVDFSRLHEDLRSVGTTPNLSYITPNLCNDGHDSPCVDGQPGGLASADSWLQKQIPPILDSPAFRKDGLLVITFDEADGDSTGPGQIPGGTDGGRVGALVLSPFTKAGTASDTVFNHFSLLASIEDLFALPRLGYAAAPGLDSFLAAVLNARP